MEVNEFIVQTPGEQESQANPALKQQGGAIAAAAEFATRLGLDEANSRALVETIRSLDKAEAKDTRKSLTTVNHFLAAAGVEVTSVVVPTETAEPVVKPTQPQPPKPVAKKTKSPNNADTEGVKQRTGTALEQLLAEEHHDNGLNLQRLDSFLSLLYDRGVDLQANAADVSHRTLIALAKIYATNPKRPDEQTVKINSSVTWGYLAGVDMNELVIWRSANKPNATKGDVHNSRASFINGVGQGWKTMIAEGQDPLAYVRAIEAEDEAEAEAEEVVESAPEPTQTESTPTQAHESVAPESYDDESPHVRLAHDYLTDLNIDVNGRALEEFFNPNSRGDLTAPKLKAVEIIRDRIRATKDGLKLLDELDIEDQSRATLHRMLGVPFGSKNGQLQQPILLRDLVRGREGIDRQQYLESTFSALQILLEALRLSSDQKTEAFLDVALSNGNGGPMQVIFADSVSGQERNS